MVTRDTGKHPFIGSICGRSCSKKCKEFTVEERQLIWKKYWNEPYEARRKFMAACITIKSVKRRRVEMKKAESDCEKPYKRNESRNYFLPHKQGNLTTKIKVCKKTFLNTLGYTSDKVITNTCQRINEGLVEECVTERRGKCEPANKISIVTKESVITHIYCFKPTTAHYRRRNAPHIRYLPRSLTVESMHRDYLQKHDGAPVSVETYRKILKEENISLHMSLSDVCSQFEEFKIDLTN